MTTYKEVFGKYVRSVSSDPPASYGEGEIWYNTSSNTFKTVAQVAAWSSSNNVNTPRRQSAGAGVQTASIIAFGYATGFSNATEEYNGSSWATQSSAPFSVYNAAAGGTQTAYVATGGDLGPSINATTAEYNGSSWSTTNNHPAPRNGASGAGSETALVSTGGNSATRSTFYYNGSTWANQSANLNTGRSELTNASCGTQTAALVVAGEVPGYVSNVEEWNGSSWSEETNISTATRQIATSGIQTLALAYGGETGPGVTAVSQQYDGSSWTTTSSMGTARRACGGLGDGSTAGAALASSGHNGSSNVSTTEEYNQGGLVQTLTTS